jgi:hypothetical protein
MPRPAYYASNCQGPSSVNPPKGAAAFFTEGPSANLHVPASKRRKAETTVGENAAFGNHFRHDTIKHARLIAELVSANKVPDQALIPMMPIGISTRRGSCRTRMTRTSLWTPWTAVHGRDPGKPFRHRRGREACAHDVHWRQCGINMHEWIIRRVRGEAECLAGWSAPAHYAWLRIVFK